MAIYSTYDQVGIKEDVSDVITNLSPTKTPFQSAIDEESVDNTLYQWQEDSLRAAAANSQPEGFRAITIAGSPAALAAGSARTATVMLGNRTQILSDVFEISRTSERVKKYGRKSEIAYQTTKVGAQLKRDLEATLLGGGSPAIGAQNVTVGSESAARLTANVLGNVLVDGSPGAMISANTTTTNSPASALTEANVLSVMQKLYNEGAEVSTVSVKPADAQVFAQFAAVNTAGTAIRQRDMQDSTTVVNVVDVYKSPWGTVRVLINRFQNTAIALFYDPDNWKLTYIDKWFKEKLAKVGDSEIFMVVGEYGLKHRNRVASGILKGLT